MIERELGRANRSAASSCFFKDFNYLDYGALQFERVGIKPTVGRFEMGLESFVDYDRIIKKDCHL
jgi:hypothetical protein